MWVPISNHLHGCLVSLYIQPPGPDAVRLLGWDWGWWLCHQPCVTGPFSQPTPSLSINSITTSSIEPCPTAPGQTKSPISDLQHSVFGIYANSFFSTVYFLYGYAAAKLLQSCLTLCDPIDRTPPGSPVPGILQARILERVAISFCIGV